MLELMSAPAKINWAHFNSDIMPLLKPQDDRLRQNFVQS